MKVRNWIYYIASILVLGGSVLHFVKWEVAPYVFAVGAAGVAVSFLTIPHKGDDFKQKRLHRMNVIASLFLLVASGTMFKPGNDWMVFLFISALLQMYAAFRSGSASAQK